LLLESAHLRGKCEKRVFTFRGWRIRQVTCGFVSIFLCLDASPYSLGHDWLTKKERKKERAYVSFLSHLDATLPNSWLVTNDISTTMPRLVSYSPDPTNFEHIVRYQILCDGMFLKLTCTLAVHDTYGFFASCEQ
jgi:hypothetical protein